MRIRKLAAAVAAVALGFAGAITTQAEAAETDVYATPGVHLVNGRYWKTTCANYSPSVIRCTTDIFATKVFLEAGRWYKQNTWAFNNLSYLPSPRSQWATNPLGNTGRWVSAEGRQWRTECDTPATGTGACRNYIVATVASETGGVVKTETKEIFNSMVRFSSSTIPAVTAIPAKVTGVTAPVSGPKLPIGVASAPKPAPVKPATPTRSQEQAIRMAEDYLDYLGFSRVGLIDQLVYEKFSRADATYAVDSLRVDWNKQAARMAKDYLEVMAFSREGLTEQLVYEGFTAEQAAYGVRAVGL